MRKSALFTGLALMGLLAGCASYRAMPLDRLTFLSGYPMREGLTVVAKAFDKGDCRTYLDRDLLEEGYQPVQIEIVNNSSASYLFSLNRVSLPCAPIEEVASSVHTSTAGRIAGYGAAAIFTCGLFAIPAIVDGVGSFEANGRLDRDFAAKGGRDQMIGAHSVLSALLFVPKSSYSDRFTVTLIEGGSASPKTFHVVAQR